jgi:hypothetical protein
VSCPAAAACTAVGREAERWNGTAWTFERLPSRGGANSPSLVGLSCPTSRGCTGIEARGYAYLWTGSRWSPEHLAALPSARYYSLSDVACPSAGSCFAVGAWFNGRGTGVPLMERWHHSHWSIQTDA